MEDLYSKILREVLNEYGFADISPEQFKKAYISKINEKRGDLITKGEKSDHFHFLLNEEVKKENYGVPNKCETNTFNYIKDKLEDGKNNFFPVGGFGFDGPNLWPVEHWWVYDKSNDKFIEVTPLQGDPFRCYAGVINFDINEEIKEAEHFYDVDFFKGGHVQHTYFK